MKVMLVTGTRPQIIKSTPIIKKLIAEPKIDLTFVHTGQHYDYELFKIFIDDFGLPDPINLEVNGDAVDMISTIMVKLKKVIDETKPDLILVPGDTNSALAAGLTAVKMDIPFGHIESGVREWDLVMHEEMNRRMLDHSASVLFVPTMGGYSNLVDEHVQGLLCFVGDTNYDLYLMRQNVRLKRQDLKLHYDLLDDFILLTTHRRENVQNERRLINILQSVSDMHRPVIFPIHPNTKKLVEKLPMKFPNIKFIDSIGYDDMMDLLEQCSLLVTDSGGLQKEAFFANTPCVTLREITAWDETVTYGANQLCGSDDIKRMCSAYKDMFNKELNNPKLYGDGNASGHIINIILNAKIEIPNERKWI